MSQKIPASFCFFLILNEQKKVSQVKIISPKKLVVNSKRAEFWFKICNFESSVIIRKTDFSLYTCMRYIKFRELKFALNERTSKTLRKHGFCSHKGCDQQILLRNKLVFFILQLSQDKASGNFFPTENTHN